MKGTVRVGLSRADSKKRKKPGETELPGFFTLSFRFGKKERK